ncbi:hypothetical protein LC593_01985 [Nostoc sp. CHAB 5844]|nr:hypothetical protein [Nostoc sp. CHAB 5844]
MRDIIYPDGKEEYILKTEHTESGLFEFCMATAMITFCIFAFSVMWTNATNSNSRRLDIRTHQSETYLREASETDY